MREVKPGDTNIALTAGELIKYRVSKKRHYTLIALYNPYNSCKGCVFRSDSGHPLSSMVGCLSTGLKCTDRIFKPVDDILEDL